MLLMVLTMITGYSGIKWMAHQISYLAKVA